MSQQWKPLQDLLVLQDRMNRLFEDATRRRTREESENEEFEDVDWYPAADILEGEGEYVIAIDLPGIDRSALDISIDGDRLAIKGTRTRESASLEKTERPGGRFVRTFGVPASVDQTRIAADYKDGVLRVRLPKQTQQQAKRIEIKVT